MQTENAKFKNCLMISYFTHYSLNILCIVTNLWPCSWSSLYLLCLACILVKIKWSWYISCPSEEVAHFLMSPTTIVLVYLHLSTLYDQLTEEEKGSQLGSMMDWLGMSFEAKYELLLSWRHTEGAPETVGRSVSPVSRDLANVPGCPLCAGREMVWGKEICEHVGRQMA